MGHHVLGALLMILDGRSVILVNGEVFICLM